jgi:hypothetical protein
MILLKSCKKIILLESNLVQAFYYTGKQGSSVQDHMNADSTIDKMIKVRGATLIS